jgi:hypothetical protein
MSVGKRLFYCIAVFSLLVAGALAQYAHAVCNQDCLQVFRWEWVGNTYCNVINLNTPQPNDSCVISTLWHLAAGDATKTCGADDPPRMIAILKFDECTLECAASAPGPHKVIDVMTYLAPANNTQLLCWGAGS